jgi:inosine/guanosine/xanthosine phosphorylase family protein
MAKVEALAALVAEGAAAIRAAMPGPFPQTALILGSGLGGFADRIEGGADLPYAGIPGFPVPQVPGHAGLLRVGRIANCPLACLSGRFHAYEGHPAAMLAVPVRVLEALGVRRLIVTSAAGGLSPDLLPGSLMLVEDHINFAGINPLAGPNDDRVGPRFPDMSRAYDPALRSLFRDAARETGVALGSGVYVFVLGPNFETPAEVRLFAGWGAQAVGMSVVPEVLAAVHCGMAVAALSVITNPGAGLSPSPLSHDETLAAASGARARVEKLLTAVCARLA